MAQIHRHKKGAVELKHELAPDEVSLEDHTVDEETSADEVNGRVKQSSSSLLGTPVPRSFENRSIHVLKMFIFEIVCVQSHVGKHDCQGECHETQSRQRDVIRGLLREGKTLPVSQVEVKQTCKEQVHEGFHEQTNQAIPEEVPSKLAVERIHLAAPPTDARSWQVDKDEDEGVEVIHPQDNADVRNHEACLVPSPLEGQAERVFLRDLAIGIRVDPRCSVD